MSNSEALIPNFPKGQLFVVSAPSGTGKSTLIHMLTKEFPRITANITYTTRQPRDYEIDGVNYHFITPKEFAEKKQRGEFLETVELYDVQYGSSIKDVERDLNNGKIVILVIDTQGMTYLKQNYDLPFTSVFVRPPSLEVLRERLSNRLTECSANLEKRLSVAEKELKVEEFYDYSIVNDDLNVAYDVLRSIFIAENHKLTKY
jgi:guanylate kinase